MFLYLHRASWQSSATLTEVFPYFVLCCKANTRVKLAKTEHGPHSSKIFVLFYVLFVLCRSVYCLYVNVYCTTATGWQPNCSLTNISYQNTKSARVASPDMAYKVCRLNRTTLSHKGNVF